MLLKIADSVYAYNFRVTLTIPHCKFSIFMTLAMNITEEVFGTSQYKKD